MEKALSDTNGDAQEYISHCSDKMAYGLQMKSGLWSLNVYSVCPNENNQQS